jgi:hypothetical protein
MSWPYIPYSFVGIAEGRPAMASLRLYLDQETFVALADRALRERRPVDWQAEVILRQALGLPFPYPAEDDTPCAQRSDHALAASEPAAASPVEGDPTAGPIGAEHTITVV